jgi:CHAT domain-containing protein
VPLTEAGTEPLGMSGGSDSLSRSALVLAEAAKGEGAASAAEDGLLTAEEARSLDLHGTQLVVLSACDTGQGDLSVGQGVYGLRRSFLVAGAETLVTSLWQVSDAATGKLMTLYYQKLLKEKKGRLAAMQEAMKQMRTQYKHPYYWAPFLVIGSDGPLRPAAKSHSPSTTP